MINNIHTINYFDKGHVSVRIDTEYLDIPFDKITPELGAVLNLIERCEDMQLVRIDDEDEQPEKACSHRVYINGREYELGTEEQFAVDSIDKIIAIEDVPETDPVVERLDRIEAAIYTVNGGKAPHDNPERERTSTRIVGHL